MHQNMTTYGGVNVDFPGTLNLGSRLKLVVSFKLRLPYSQYALDRVLRCPTTHLSIVQKRKVSISRRKSNSHIRFVQPVASSLHLLSCMASPSHPVILNPTVKSNHIPIHNYRVIPDGCSSRSLLTISYFLPTTNSHILV